MRRLGVLLPRSLDPNLADAVLPILAGDLIAGWVAHLKGVKAAEFGDVDRQAREVDALMRALKLEGVDRRRRLLVEHYGDLAGVVLAERHRWADDVCPDSWLPSRARANIGALAVADGECVDFCFVGLEERFRVSMSTGKQWTLRPPKVSIVTARGHDAPVLHIADRRQLIEAMGDGAGSEWADRVEDVGLLPPKDPKQ